jgi:hypothetical protein
MCTVPHRFHTCLVYRDKKRRGRLCLRIYGHHADTREARSLNHLQLLRRRGNGFDPLWGKSVRIADAGVVCVTADVTPWPAELLKHSRGETGAGFDEFT